MVETLLARSADDLFWLARYVERTENLARILDVNETFSRDSRGGQNWRSIVELFSDEDRFFARYKNADTDSVIRFYVSDTANPTSIVSGIRSARENARALRPLISTEMWVQLNVFHNRLSQLSPSELAPGQRNLLLTEVKEACQTHTGITDGTFYRDQGWYFYQMGRLIERGDQITRLLDMKYHMLLPREAEIGSPLDVSQWNALLRSAAGYHAYRRLHSGAMTASQVAGFLLLNRRFPRSLYLCVRETEMLLSELRTRYSLRPGNQAAEVLDGLRALLSTLSITEILTQGLHEFLDLMQVRLIEVSRHLSYAFFGRGEQSQSQSQWQSG